MFAFLKRSVFSATLCAGLLLPLAAGARTLIVATISDEPIKETRTFLPFARHLAAQLQPEGITGGEVRIARDIDHMAALLRSGEVDIYIDSPLVSLAVGEKCGSRMLARRWKKGIAEYRSVIFARQDSGISTLEDLTGRVLVFEENFSSSGYLLPRLSLSESGVSLSELANPREKPPSDATGFVFSGDDENTVVWVLHGLADAGAMSLNGLKKKAGDDFGLLTVISQTEAIPRHVVSVSPNTPAGFAASIQNALLQLNQTEQGRAVLQGFEKTSKFDLIPQETQDMLNQLQDPVTALIGG